ADQYTDSLEATFQLITENPTIGRPVDYVSKGLHRHEHMEHVIFYRIRQQEIFVVRLLHASMDVSKQL
ncbi:MAG: type II toxin-antitoxin system RelE/ParE family toxin, partial [Gammaproteobacteria bacterium]|nr:type II toxin-antitoxin system RelE/ParE family toxin [Gammaproteobacteria bacterium]